MLQDVIRLRQLSVVKVTERGDVFLFTFSCLFLQPNEQYLVFPDSQTGETAMSEAVQCKYQGLAMDWARTLNRKAQILSQASPCGVCYVQRGNWTGISPSTSISPVSIIPPMLYTHSFI
jgi:hypothetical protein